MASTHCYKPTNETCQQKCLESCYEYNKPNQTGSYYSGHSMASHQNPSASYGQTYCPDIAKPKHMNSYGHHVMTDQCHSMAKPGPTHTHGMGQAHGQYHPGHSHGHVGQQYGSNGNGMIASCHGKSHHEKKADCYNKKKDKSHKMKNKHKDCNRSCGNSSSDESDSDCN